jgi:hypothetical protein
MSTVDICPEHFRLDAERLAAHLLAEEGELRGFRSGGPLTPAAAAAERFRDAQTAGAINHPGDAGVALHAVAPRGLIATVCDRGAAELRRHLRCRQLATYVFDAERIAPPGDERFEVCVDGITEVLGYADVLVPKLRLLTAEWR